MNAAEPQDAAAGRGGPRERRPADWDRDLAERHDIEDGFAHFLAAEPTLSLTGRHTDSYDECDFTVVERSGRELAVELKAKRQRYGRWANACWPGADERDLFLLDERSWRVLCAHGPYAFLVVANLPVRRWAVFSAGDLMVCSKMRLTRPIRKVVQAEKGKLLINLLEAALLTTAGEDAAAALASLAERVERQWLSAAPWPGGAPVHHFDFGTANHT